MREVTRKKYLAVKKEYERLSNKKYKGVRIYTDQYVFKKLSEKFFLSPATIEHLVYTKFPYLKD